MLTFVLLCLQGTGGQAYAQEDKAGERRIRYSSSYLKEAEIPEAPEEYLEEGEITYRLVGTEIEAGGFGGDGLSIRDAGTGDPGESADGSGGSGEPEDGIGYAGSEKNLL